MSAPSPFPIIDSHQHFWTYDPLVHQWIDDSMGTIRKDFLPADLQTLLQQYGVAGTVAVQVDQSETENERLLDFATAYSFIKGVVGWVNLQDPQVNERLQFYSGYKAMKGFRHILQGEPCRDLMLQPSFMHGISLLEQYHFTYDILIYPDQLPYASQIVEAFPNQRFVVDHLAKPPIKTGEIHHWKKDIKTLAQNQNVWCKISGMVTEAHWKQSTYQDFVPYLDVVVEAFGTKRIMYGSDWPVCLVAAPYAKVLGMVQQYFSTFSASEQQDFFANNATAFYQL